MTDVRRGTILTFDSTTWTALVMLDGSDAESRIPVGQWVPATQLVANAEVAVLVFGDTNTDDGVVLGAYGAVGTTDTPQFSGLNVGGALAAPAGEVRVSGLVRTNSVSDVALAMQKITNLANLGKVVLGALPASGGFIFVFNSNSNAAIFVLQGGAHTTQLVSDPSGVYSIDASHTVAKTNVYWNGSAYELENRIGGAQSYWISYLGT